MGKGKATVVQDLTVVISAVAILSASAIARAGSVLRLRAGQFAMSELAIPPIADSLMAEQNQKPQHYILQFKRPINRQERASLQSRGVSLLRYVPDDAYIVRATQMALVNLQNSDVNVRGFTQYQAAFKMSPEIATINFANQNPVALLNVYLLDSQNEVVAALKKMGAQVVENTPRVVVVRVARTKISDIAHIDGIEWVAEKPQAKILDYSVDGDGRPQIPSTLGHISQLTGYETGTKVMNFNPAWKAGLTGQGQLVAVGDTGLDTGDLSTLSADFSNVLYKTIIYGLASTTWADPVGHGTHVSGSIVGQGALSNGLVHGGAYGAELLMQSLYSAKYQALTPPSDIGTMFQDAYNQGARIHSDSWGAVDVTPGMYDAQAEAFDQFIWQHPNFVILVAAGNSGVDSKGTGRVDPDSVTTPATAKDVITVGASKNYVPNEGLQIVVGEAGCSKNPKTGQITCPWPEGPLSRSGLSDNPNGLAPFSSRGPTADGRIKPDIVAPGTNILSDCSHDPGAGTLWGRFNQNYCWSGGTSMATPLTASAVAVIRQYLQSSSIPSPSAALIKALLIHTADDLYPGEFGAIGAANGQEILTHAPNGDEGYGRVDVANVVNDNLSVQDEKDGVGTGESRQYQAPAGTRKVTLVYTDYPGSPTAAAALVNNLELEVDVGGRAYRSSSEVDNVRQVVVPQDVAARGGAVTIVVTGKNVPMGNADNRQPFAVVYSN